MSTTSPAPEAKDYTYFHERLDPLGWTPAGNVVYLPAKNTGDNVARELPLFDANAAGDLVIPYYRITGQRAEYRRGDDKWGKPYEVLRLRNPIVGADGSLRKYKHPSGTGTLPWFPPSVIDAYNSGTEFNTLILVEGVLKAYAGSLAGLMMVGMPGIHNVKDKETSTLHSDLVSLLKKCKPREVVWLQDGDCKNLSAKWPEDPTVDLYTRPNSFFTSARNLGVLLKDYARMVGFDTYYMHVVSDAVAWPEKQEAPKGLDDLLLAYPEAKVQAEATRHTPKDPWVLPTPERREELRTMAVAEIVADLSDFSRPPKLFERRELDRPDRMRDYFHLRSADSFYAAHQERIGDKEFIYDGTKYQWSEAEKELKIRVPSTAKKYVRVGVDYWRYIKIRDPRTKVLQEVLKRWSRPTIIEDHGKHFCEHIPKLDAFTCVPDHIAYQKVIDNNLNSYAPFEHQPDPDAEPPVKTLQFLEHIFGSGTVRAAHPKRLREDGTPEIIEVKELDLGLDYLKLMYEQPLQTLPIFCPVSKERGTGKTTFFNYLQMLFGENCCSIGAKDLESDFNAHYASKKIVVIDEALVSKQESVEKLKKLSTDKFIMVNNKGIAQYQQPFFACFLMASNNIRNFIRTDEDETRFWVRRIPVIPQKDLDVKLEDALRDEIPAFLHYLAKRPMATENLYRAWFHPPLLNTDALKEVREHSASTVSRTIRDHVRVLFFAKPEMQEILMTVGNIKSEWFKGQNSIGEKYIREVLKDEMGADTYRNAKGEKATTPYGYWRFVESKDGMDGPSLDLQYFKVKVPSRPYVFRRSDFLTAEDELLVRELVDPNPNAPARTTAVPEAVADDLPF